MAVEKQRKRNVKHKEHINNLFRKKSKANEELSGSKYIAAILRGTAKRK